MDTEYYSYVQLKTELTILFSSNDLYHWPHKLWLCRKENWSRETPRIHLMDDF